MNEYYQGKSDCEAIVGELIDEYKDLHKNQAARIKAGLGSSKLALDYVMVINALKRVIDLLKDLQPPGPGNP